MEANVWKNKRDLTTTRHILADVRAQVGRVEPIYYGYNSSFDQMDAVIDQLASNVRDMMNTYEEEDDKT